MKILTADIGGTKTKLGIFDAESNIPIQTQTFFNRDFDSVESLIATFIKAQPSLNENVRVEVASLAVAGPVRNGVCHMTNLSWIVDAPKIASRFQIKTVHLLHDFEAVIWSTVLLQEQNYLSLNAGTLEDDALRIAVGAGTGFGLSGAFCSNQSNKKRVSKIVHSEVGHSTFGPSRPLEMELLQFIQLQEKKSGKNSQRISAETLLSGAGLFLMYRFFVEEKRVSTIAETLEKVNQSKQKEGFGKIIGEQAIAQNDDACVKAAELFASVFGAALGNICLTMLPRGGVYIAGGIAKKLLPFINTSIFLDSFLGEHHMTDLLREIEIRLILEENAALWGCWLKATST